MEKKQDINGMERRENPTDKPARDITPSGGRRVIIPYFRSEDKDFTLLKGDSMDLLGQFKFKFDAIFADPPYFLSNGGLSFQSGEVVCVDKGDWDKSEGTKSMDEFNMEWIAACRDKLKDEGTIWISATHHNFSSVDRALNILGFKNLNVITWVKTKHSPSVFHRSFTYSTEAVIWARKSQRKAHYFDFELMRHINGGKQMTDVWNLPLAASWEKSCGKHPTQKPLCLLARILLASTRPGDWVLDPFAGSCTTGIAASLLGRRFLGIDSEREYLEIGKERREELDQDGKRNLYIDKLDRQASLGLDYINDNGMVGEEPIRFELPF